METGKHFINNQKRLDSLTNPELEWAIALEKCREHIKIRLKRRTVFGAHTEERLGEEPYSYYISYAYDAILSGRWEWKAIYTLPEQMILIADSTISTEVEKVENEKKKKVEKISYDDLNIRFHEQDIIPQDIDSIKEILINKQILIIEETVKGDRDLEYFWDCVKEGMKRADVIEYLEITPRQQDKLRERFISKIKNSPYFEMA